MADIWQNGMIHLKNKRFSGEQIVSAVAALVLLASMVACGEVVDPVSAFVEDFDGADTVSYMVFQNELPDPYENLVSSDSVSEDPRQQMGANLRSARAINSDSKAWLYVPNTAIYDVVLQSSDNDYYLRRNVYRNWTLYGCYFADYRVSFEAGKLSRNIVIYGHAFSDNPEGMLFAQYRRYLDVEFARSNPVIYLTTKDQEYRFQVFAIFYSDLNFYYWDVNATQANLKTIISEAKLRSQLNFNVSVVSTDTILTLSSCTYQFGNRDDQRCVLMARLIPEGERVPTTNNTITANPNPKRPTF